MKAQEYLNLLEAVKTGAHGVMISIDQIERHNKGAGMKEPELLMEMSKAIHSVEKFIWKKAHNFDNGKFIEPNLRPARLTPGLIPSFVANRSMMADAVSRIEVNKRGEMKKILCSTGSFDLSKPAATALNKMVKSWNKFIEANTAKKVTGEEAPEEVAKGEEE